MEKITKRDMYTMIKDALSDYEEVAEFCDKEIAALDKKAAKAKETAAKKKVEGDELRDVIQETLSETDFEPIAVIASRIEGEDVTVAKVTYRLNALVKLGLAEKTEIEVEGTEGQKKRRIMGYRAVVAD